MYGGSTSQKSILGSRDSKIFNIMLDWCVRDHGCTTLLRCKYSLYFWKIIMKIGFLFRVFLVVGAFSTFVGCATYQELGREEQISLYKGREVASVRVYPDMTKEKYLLGIEKLFAQAYKPKTLYQHSVDRVVAMKHFTRFFLIAEQIGVDVWVFNFRELPGRKLEVSIRFKVAVAQDAFPVIPVIGDWSVSEAPIIMGQAEYNLMFDRLEYMMGLGARWVRCDEFLRYVEDNKYESFNPFGTGPVALYACRDGDVYGARLN